MITLSYKLHSRRDNILPFWKILGSTFSNNQCVHFPAFEPAWFQNALSVMDRKFKGDSAAFRELDLWTSQIRHYQLEAGVTETLRSGVLKSFSGTVVYFFSNKGEKPAELINVPSPLTARSLREQWTPRGAPPHRAGPMSLSVQSKNLISSLICSISQSIPF